MDKLEKRKFTAKLARQFYNHEISSDELFLELPEDSNDDDIEYLISLITHEPQIGGILGVDKSRHEVYLAKVFELIIKLEN